MMGLRTDLRHSLGTSCSSWQGLHVFRRVGNGVDDRTGLRHSLGISCSSWQGLHVHQRVGSEVEDRPKALLGKSNLFFSSSTRALETRPLYPPAVMMDTLRHLCLNPNPGG
jgi:hypothetical protein